MRVCVQGLWHLGTVTAACLASVGHNVIGLDTNLKTISNLAEGRAPIFEPGLNELLQAGVTSGKLEFTSSHSEALASTELLWVAFDTPVNDDDQADVDFVLDQVKISLPFLPDDTVILVSSQMPVGSIRKLEAFAQQNLPSKTLIFACSPENLRLGNALDGFLNPDRIVAGVRDGHTRRYLEKLFTPITDKVKWMSVESAEMTKHAINAFLAVSISFANEIAAICELVGADAKDIEYGLKTDTRIGPKAYLSAGGPFAGGTLARDVGFLCSESQSHTLATPLLSAVHPSNHQHKHWVRRKLQQQFDSLNGVSIAIWGLTYKPGTDTLRGSLAAELCDWLFIQGAQVNVYDPAVKQLPDHWAGKAIHAATALDAVTDAEVLVVSTEWPEFKQAALGLLGKARPDLVVVDAGRYLQAQMPQHAFNYLAVGMPSKIRAN